VLPLSFSALWMPDSAPVDLAREQRPELLSIAEGLPQDPDIEACARDGSFAEALELLWARVA
jgi:hypothetical protein